MPSPSDHLNAAQRAHRLTSASGGESSEALENSSPLEAPRVRYVTAPNQAVPHRAVSDERSHTHDQPISDHEPVRGATVSPTPLVNQAHEVTVPLLDERLVVSRRRHKVGEVVIRKEVETQIVEVPIRREKLIVEQVSPEYEQLAVVELGAAQVVDSNTSTEDERAHPHSIGGKFTSISAAIRFLEAIAADPSAGSQDVQLNVVLEDAAKRAIYQRWLEQYSAQTKR